MSDGALVAFEQKARITVGRIQAASVLDAMNVARFGQDVMACVKAKPGLHLLLDFEQVDYLSSAVLTELLRINEGVKAVGGTFRLCGLNSDITKVFEITNLNKIFTIYQGPDAVARYERSLNVVAQENAWHDLMGDE